jgi:hypothetical protein
MRFANADRIRSLDFALSGISGTGSLSPRARRTLAVYCALVKMGFEGVSAPMGAIADAVYRSSHGEAGSIRTLQRAHPELEKRGFIRCANFRPRGRTKGALIHFNLDAFAYWTGRKTQNIQPLPTSSHNVVSRETMCDKEPHTTSCHPPDRTRTESQVTPNIIPSTNKEPRAGARSIKKSKRQKRSAVWTSVNIVLGAMTQLHRQDRRAARARAKCELEASAAGVELVNPSGVDWSYWEKRFAEMPIAVRELTAAREIIPLLIGRKGVLSSPELSTPVSKVPPPSAPSSSPETNDLGNSDPVSAEDIRRARKALEERFSLPGKQSPVEIADSTKVISPATAPVAVDMSSKDLEVLIAARDRARSRVNCG